MTKTDEGKQDLAASIMIGRPIELTDQSNEVPEGTIRAKDFHGFPSNLAECRQTLGDSHILVQ